MRSKTLQGLVLGTLLGLSLHAAETALPVQLRFVALSHDILGAGIAEAEGKATPLVISASSLSRPITHPSRRLRLVSTSPSEPEKPKVETVTNPEATPALPRGFRKEKTVESSGKVKAGKQELGSIDLPAGDHTRYIIIVHPGKGGGLSAIPDRLGSFPPGSDRYVNLTTIPVIVDVPSGRQTLPPSGSIVLRPGVTNLRQYHLSLLVKSDGQDKPFFSAFTAQDDGRRNLRILIPGGSDDRDIELKTISDGLAAEDNYR
ncbi:MAG: hypothetical protein RLZZ412_142 [Verrucomicrobiota bacterium]